jgi:hypothetical protein
MVTIKCYKVAPPSYVYSKVVKVSKNWEKFKALVEYSKKKKTMDGQITRKSQKRKRGRHGT